MLRLKLKLVASQGIKNSLKKFLTPPTTLNPLIYSSCKQTCNTFAIAQHINILFVSLRNSTIHFQSNTFILRKVKENLCDTAYKKYCEIAISKEVCLHYVTQSL